MYNTYLRNKERNHRGLCSSHTILGVQIKDFKVVSMKGKEVKKRGHKINTTFIQEEDENLVNSRKIMRMSNAFPPLKY